MESQRIKISENPIGTNVYSIDIPEDNRIPLKMIHYIFPGASLIAYQEETNDVINW